MPFIDQGGASWAGLIRCEFTFVKTSVSAHIGWEHSMCGGKY